MDPIRKGFGMRLKAARLNKQMSQTQVGQRFGVGKETVSAWETGRGDPGVYRLRELAKLYDVSADALLWENALSNEAMQLAAEFDGLNEEQRRTLRAVWMAYVTQTAIGGENLPPAPSPVTEVKGSTIPPDLRDLLVNTSKPGERKKA
jgi:transcriptional regulator with XRE-family HTH domain